LEISLKNARFPRASTSPFHFPSDEKNAFSLLPSLLPLSYAGKKAVEFFPMYRTGPRVLNIEQAAPN
jgi:hypothetical protein